MRVKLKSQCILSTGTSNLNLFKKLRNHLKGRFEEQTENCSGLPSYSHRPAMICRSELETEMLRKIKFDSQPLPRKLQQQKKKLLLANKQAKQNKKTNYGELKQQIVVYTLTM